MTTPIFQFAIAHNLKKETGILDTELITSNTTFNINDESTKMLVNNIYNSFGKDSNRPDVGNFKEQHSRGVFAAECCAYSETDYGDGTNFIKLSKKFASELKKSIEIITSAIGGYIVCTQYSLPDEGSFILFAIIRDQTKLIFNEDLSLQKTLTIDTDKLRFAFKIKLKQLKEFVRYENEQGVQESTVDFSEEELENNVEDFMNYLYIIASSEKDKTNYFADVVGYEKGLNSKMSTEKLFQFITDKFANHDIFKSKISDIRDSTANYLSSQKNSQITLTDLASFYSSELGGMIPDPEAREIFFKTFADEMASDKYGMPNSFIANKSIYQSHTHTTIKNNNYELKLKNSKIDTEDENAELYWNKDENYINIRITVTEEILKQLPTRSNG